LAEHHRARHIARRLLALYPVGKIADVDDVRTGAHLKDHHQPVDFHGRPPAQTNDSQRMRMNRIHPVKSAGSASPGGDTSFGNPEKSGPATSSPACQQEAADFRLDAT